jgi:threonine/homoserine/homoserine lactone efflux protein
MPIPIEARTLAAVAAAWSVHLEQAAMVLAFLVGLVLGFIGSIPVAGPTSVIVLKNTLEKGNREGLDIAAGAGLAEAIYAFLAFWGLTTALVQFPGMANAARVVGAVLILVVGMYLVRYRTNPRRVREAAENDRQEHRWLRGFASAILNPTLLVTWTTVVAALHAMSLLRMRGIDALPFALGVGVGIMGWFVLLVKLAQHFRDRVRPETLDRVVRGMGWGMIAIGAVVVSRVAFKLYVG